jgi:hypothetical protein
LTDDLNNVSFQNKNISSLALCMESNVTEIYSGTIYTTTNNNLNKYFFLNETYKGMAKQINLYNFPYISFIGSNISTLIVTLKDTSFNDYPNIIGKLSRYYPINHSWITVQMDKSDTFGRLFYDIIEQNVEYKLEFYDETTYLDSTGTMKFTCTYNVCNILFQINPQTVTTANTAINYTYDNSTHLLNIDFTDSSNTMVYIEAILDKETITGLTHI